MARPSSSHKLAGAIVVMICSRVGFVAATAGCADGSREGFASTSTFPRIAACAGSFSGSVTAVGSATPSVCAYGWEICTGVDVHATYGVTFAQATAFGGCFAYNAGQDCNACFSPCDAQESVSSIAGCPDGPAGIDKAAVGSGCGHVNSAGSSCLFGSGRIDAGPSSCSWSSSGSPSQTGLACCWRYSCAAGKYHTAGGCVACDAGTFSAAEDAASCAPCPAGQYASASGSSACVTCSAGKMQPEPGRTSCYSVPTAQPTVQPVPRPTEAPTSEPTMQRKTVITSLTVASPEVRTEVLLAETIRLGGVELTASSARRLATSVDDGSDGEADGTLLSLFGALAARVGQLEEAFGVLKAQNQQLMEVLAQRQHG